MERPATALRPRIKDPSRKIARNPDLKSVQASTECGRPDPRKPGFIERSLPARNNDRGQTIADEIDEGQALGEDSVNPEDQRNAGDRYRTGG